MRRADGRKRLSGLSPAKAEAAFFVGAAGPASAWRSRRNWRRQDFRAQSDIAFRHATVTLRISPGSSSLDTGRRQSCARGQHAGGSFHGRPLPVLAAVLASVTAAGVGGQTRHFAEAPEIHRPDFRPGAMTTACPIRDCAGSFGSLPGPHGQVSVRKPTIDRLALRHIP